MFEDEKVFQIIGIARPTEQSINPFTYIFQGFCLHLKNLSIIFGTTLGEHLTMAASANLKAAARM